MTPVEFPPRRVLIAMASFKGTLRSAEACRAVSKGLAARWPTATFILVPLADGGTGTVEAVLASLGGERMMTRVTGPLGSTIEAVWGMIDDTTAVIELAAASGLALVPKEQRDPLRTTTRGTGELIRAALDRGCTRILLGIGDSATVEGGLGACQALGIRFMDRQNSEIIEPMTGGLLGEIASVDITTRDRRLETCAIEVLCDVSNPLLGADGAAHIFGPQKGASPRGVEQLEENLAQAFDVIEAATHRQVRALRGAGAAGGFGAGAVALLDAAIVSGTERLLALSRFEEQLDGCDLLVTGEGRLDSQSLRGKATGRVILAAKALGIPVCAICGLPPDDATLTSALGLRAFVALHTAEEMEPKPETARDELTRAAREMHL